MRLTRADRSVLSDWWFTVDRLMFFALLLLMGAGLVLSFAASPPIAARYNLEPFYFVRRQAAMLVPAIIIMFAASTLNPKQIRRASLIIFVTGIALMVVILAVGPEIKGAKRWIELGPFSLQPSEFVKPAFVVLTAWLFNEAQKRRDVPGIELAVALYAVFAVLLVMQPDFGQTLLVTYVWGALVFMAGINLIWIGALGAAGVVGIFSAYFLAPHVASRIDRFLNPASGDTYQTDRWLEILPAWRLVWTRPGRGHRKGCAPQLSHRLHFRGGRRGIWTDRFSSFSSLCSLSSCCVASPRPRKNPTASSGTQSRASSHAVRATGAHQYGGQCRDAPGQGHDLAFHLLWWLIAARHGSRHRGSRSD